MGEELDRIVKRLTADGIFDKTYTGEVVHYDKGGQYAFLLVDGRRCFMRFNRIEGGGVPRYQERFRVELDEADRVTRAFRIAVEAT